MNLLLLRHGETAGNSERRYVGRKTDEGLTEETVLRLKGITEEKRRELYQNVGIPKVIYTSPMMRCKETAALIFQNSVLPFVEVPGLEECDFGRFEYKNYMELNGDPEYQKFLDSGGILGFPDGETVEQFRKRSVLAFSRLIQEEERTAAFVVHGGTVMAVMEAFAVPKRDYFSWQVKNLEGFSAKVCRKEDGFFLTDVAKVKIL